MKISRDLSSSLERATIDDDGEAKERSDGARSLEEVRRDASERARSGLQDARTGDAGRRGGGRRSSTRVRVTGRAGATNAEGEERE